MKAILDQARTHEIEQCDGSIQVEDASSGSGDDEDDTDNDNDEPSSYGEIINNDFNAPVGYEEGATGVTIEFDNVLHAQYCSCGNIYYQPIEIY